MTRPLTAFLTALALLAAPAAAPAQTGAERSIVLEAADGLRTSPVYVDQSAEEAISRDEEARLERLIDDEKAGPLYIAIVPEAIEDEAGGSPDAALSAIVQQVRRPGTYALVSGNTLRAGATSGVLDRGEAGRIATDAIEVAADGNAYEVLREFVERVGEARANGGEVPGKGPGGGGFGGLALLGLLGGGAALFAFSRNRRRRREREAQVAELRETAREDLIALGDDVRALDLDVEMPGADEQAKADYGRALERYEEAERGLDRARDPADFGPIGEALEEGRWAMASAKARLQGQTPPERRPPCFFDPRHGPSTREVEWAPDGYGAMRSVPVCEADAVRLEQGQEPMTREIVTGGRRVPYYDAPGYYSPFYGGFYGGFSGFLPGLMFGSMLGGAFGGWGASDVAGGSMGGGDFGGGFGDFGGGDFGGGGFGDFGGGDFGGGGDF
ncbi:MAG TPA: hypothetical protein VF587_04740 [Solirubrobacteraceae bacterium]